MANSRAETPAALTAVDCLAGGGNMGALMRAYEWKQTPLGSVETWPQSLRTAVSIMLASGFPMLVLWGDEYIQLYNDAYRPVLGATKHPAALGQRARDCWPEIWGEVLGPMFGRVMAGGEPIWSEDLLFILDRNGYLEETYFTFSYSAIRDETGRPGGVLVTCVETTERVLGERRLRTLRALAAHPASTRVTDVCRAAAQVLTENRLDLSFALLYLKEGDCSILHGSSGLPPGTPVSAERVGADNGGPWPVGRVADTGELEWITDPPSSLGQLVEGPWPEPVTTAAVLPIAPSGQSPALGALVVGLSPRRALDVQYRSFLELVARQTATLIATARAMEAERERAEALASLDRAKTAFFSNISHEFRTPLTLLLGPTEDALASPARALSGDALEAVYRNELRLLKLVNALLDFARLEADRTRASYRPTDLSALTRDLASAFRSLVERAGLSFEVQCDALSAPVYVDREMWEKIVLNLLSNAFKFTFEGAIQVSVSEVAGAVQLRVSDTGVGIPDRELPHIFDRFHRVQGSRSRSYEGSGIGLALVHDLVRLHGGTIEAHSQPDEGTTFLVHLPTGFAHLPAQHVDHDARGSSPGSSAVAYVEQARRWVPEQKDASDPATAAPVSTIAKSESTRILVADDNADMRDYLTRLLETRWAVECVENGVAALAAIRRNPPALVLLDVMMPGLDGFEVLRRMRADPATRTVPLIMLSARAGEEARVEGLAAGADDYLIKPFSARELIARVGTQVELSKLRAEAAGQYEKLHSLFQLAPAAIALLRGPDHVFELANELYFTLIGRREIIGRPGREALPELVDQGIWDLMDRVYETGEVYVGTEFQVGLNRRGDGVLESAYFDFVWQPIRSARGDVEAIFVHAVDVTGQVQARREVETARQAAEAANRAKDEFLAMLGHELRNPLAPILTALQLMTLRGDEGATRERAVIDRQVRHLARLVDDLLDVSRIARGKVDLRKKPVELAEIVARAIEMASPLLEERLQNLAVDVPRHGLRLMGDLTRLAQVVMNLLTNAAKYSEPGGRIGLRARALGREVEIRVRDSGIGISSDMLPKVFDSFAQERQALDRSRGGLGLGLTIVKNLVGLHDGTVEAHSDGLGRGSEFIVRLPLLTPTGPPRKRRQRKSKHVRAARALRVLVVDDNADAAYMIADALAAVGHTTCVVPDGPAALEATVDFSPDVALLDLGLPVMDGYELAERLRDEGGTRTPILVAVTGYGQESDRQRSRQAGFHAHIVKPVDFDALNEVLDRLAREEPKDHAT